MQSGLLLSGCVQPDRSASRAWQEEVSQSLIDVQAQLHACDRNWDLSNAVVAAFNVQHGLQVTPPTQQYCQMHPKDLPTDQQAGVACVAAVLSAA